MKKSLVFVLICIAALATSVSTPAIAQEPYQGEIRAFGMTFCPRGWLEANGDMLPVTEYSALFSLLGTIYGGDGRTTFALPDLRGRSVVGKGEGSGLPPYSIGRRSTLNYHDSGGPTTGQLAVTYCIAVSGLYPSRN